MAPRAKAGKGRENGLTSDGNQVYYEDGHLCGLPAEILLDIVSLLFRNPLASLPPTTFPPSSPPRFLPSKLHIRLLLYRHLASVNSTLRSISIIPFLTSIDAFTQPNLDGLVKFIKENPRIKSHIGELRVSFSRFHETKCQPSAPRQRLLPSIGNTPQEENGDEHGDEEDQDMHVDDSPFRSGSSQLQTTYAYTSSGVWTPSVTLRAQHYYSFLNLICNLFSTLSTSLRTISISQSCSTSDLSHRYHRSWQTPDFSNPSLIGSLTEAAYENLRNLILVDPTPVESWGDVEGLGKFQRLKELTIVLRSRDLVEGFSNTRFCPPRSLTHLSIYDEALGGTNSRRDQQEERGLKWPLSSDFARCDFLQSLDLSFLTTYSLAHKETQTAVGFLISTYAPTLRNLSLCGGKMLTAKERPPTTSESIHDEVQGGGGAGKTFDEAIGYWDPYTGSPSSLKYQPSSEDIAQGLTPIKILETILEELVTATKETLVFPNLKHLELRGSQSWKLDRLLGKKKALMPKLEKLTLDHIPEFQMDISTVLTGGRRRTNRELSNSEMANKLWNLPGITGAGLKQIWLDIEFTFPESMISKNKENEKVVKLRNGSNGNGGERRGLDRGRDAERDLGFSPKFLIIKALTLHQVINNASEAESGGGNGNESETVWVSIKDERISGSSSSGGSGGSGKSVWGKSLMGRSVGTFDLVDWEERLGIRRWVKMGLRDCDEIQ